MEMVGFLACLSVHLPLKTVASLTDSRITSISIFILSVQPVATAQHLDQIYEIYNLQFYKGGGIIHTPSYVPSWCFGSKCERITGEYLKMHNDE
jgi:hypothetical protein